MFYPTIDQCYLRPILQMAYPELMSYPSINQFY